MRIALAGQEGVLGVGRNWTKLDDYGFFEHPYTRVNGHGEQAGRRAARERSSRGTVDGWDSVRSPSHLSPGLVLLRGRRRTRIVGRLRPAYPFTQYDLQK